MHQPERPTKQTIQQQRTMEAFTMAVMAALLNPLRRDHISFKQAKSRMCIRERSRDIRARTIRRSRRDRIARLAMHLIIV